METRSDRRVAGIVLMVLFVTTVALWAFTSDLTWGLAAILVTLLDVNRKL